MRTSIKSYATAGTAMAAASVIAITPVGPPVAEAEARSASPAVALTATFDPLTPWLTVFNDTEVNTAALVDEWLNAPFPAVQQTISNWIYYLSNLDTLGQSLEQIGENAVAAVEAPFVAGENLNLLNDATHAALYPTIVGLDPDIEPILSLLASPLSGLALGFVGPAISPILALMDSVHTTYDFIKTGDWVDALNTLVNIPAALTGAVLNGYGELDLNALIPLLAPALPSELTINDLSLSMGGLLSPAGSGFNSVGLDATLKVGPLPVPVKVPAGAGAGFIGTLIATPKAIAQAIGWDSAAGGNPLAPPLTPPYTPTADDEAQEAEDEAPEEEVDEEVVAQDAAAVGEEDGAAEEVAEEEVAEEEAVDEDAAEEEATEEEVAEEGAEDGNGAEDDNDGEGSDDADGDNDGEGGDDDGGDDADGNAVAA